METQLVGKASTNPILDMRIYEVQFPDGHMAEYAANMITECIYSQVDDEGHRSMQLDEIIDYLKTDNAVEDENIFQISHNGNIHQQRNTKG
jgi:hypothetical protein